MSKTTHHDSPTPASSAASPDSPGIDQGGLAPGELVRKIQKQREEMLFLAKIAFAMLDAVAHFVSYPALILFRWNLGERLLSKTAMLVVWIVAATVAVTSKTSVGYLLTFALPILFFIHTLQAKRRSKRGERHYSYCRGASWLDKLLPNRAELNKQLFEPMILLVMALLMLVIGYFTGGADLNEMTDARPANHKLIAAYLAAMGLGLGFVESRLRKQERDLILTHIDQQIISTYLAAALNDTQAIKDEGFSIAELANWSPQQMRMLEESQLPAFSSKGDAPFDPAWDNRLDPRPHPRPLPPELPRKVTA